jgi:hypothetical protein
VAAVESGTGARLRRWLLPLALTFSVLGMHHVPAEPVEQVMTMAAHGSEPGAPVHDDPGHDLLHLCLVVLAAAATLLLAWLLTPATSGAPALVAHRPGVRAQRRRAPPAGRALLTVVCVSRT